MLILRSILLSCVLVVPLSPSAAQTRDSEPLRIVFLGDQGHHRPADRAAQLIPVMRARDIQIEYTEDQDILAADRLAKYDGLIIYANIVEITPAREKALLDYVASGGGFIPLHCASYCFLNSPKYIQLVGAQFRQHGGEEFSTEVAQVDHAIVKGYEGFRSWDETYVHHQHNQDRTVLEYRVQGMQAAGKEREPWTWIRTHGDGRVFYTAWGHDQRTWRNAGFHDLVERGIRWACGDDDPSAAAGDPRRFRPPTMTERVADVAPFEFDDVGAKIPNYTPGASWGTQSDPQTKMQRPLSAEQSQKHYVTPQGFAMQLFAAEPDLEGKPIAMNWDERGRLWVCETVDYPNELQRSGAGHDRIRICEDTDGDGRADQFTVFAEELSIPTAITFYRGGAIVQNGVETLYLKDTDGDDRADVREVLVSGWALGDTHGGVSNFRYGLDNWIWAMQGYNNSAPRINGQRQPPFRMGFFRFRLDQSDPPTVVELEFVRSTDNNTWGLGLSEEGLVFGSTANRNPSVFMPIANRYYERVRGWSPAQLGTIADSHRFQPITSKVRQVDQHGGYTAGAGHALYTARVYPQQWWNRTAFVCGPTGHLVGTFVLEADGAGFRSSSPCNLVASDDEWAAPIAAEVGPDGLVWILDWYNFIVQHNPTPEGFQTGRGNAYESDLRDKKHGRIYRLVYGLTDQAAVPPANPSVDDWLSELRHPTFFRRLTAQRMLVERGDGDIVPTLVSMLGDQSVDEIGLNVGVIHALWTLEGLGAIDRSTPEVVAAVERTLEHPSAGVRRNALAVLPRDPEATQRIISVGLPDDDDAQVRLAALLALSEVPPSDLVGRLLADRTRAAVDADDSWLLDATTCAAATHGLAYLTSLATSDPPSEAARSIAATVSQHLARGSMTADHLATVMACVTESHSALAESVLGGLLAGWPSGHAISLGAGPEQLLPALFDRLPLGAKGQLVQLSMVWGTDALAERAAELATAMLTAVADESLPDADRAVAAQRIVGFRPDDAGIVQSLLDQISPQISPQLTQAILESAGASTAPGVAREIVSRARQMTPATRDAAIRVLLARPAMTTALLDGIEGGELVVADLKLNQKQALGNYPDRRIRRRAVGLIAAGGGLPDADRQWVLEQRRPLTELAGDPAVGKQMFVKHCSKCHVHGSEGKRIGPELTGMAVHPKTELLLQILDPSRNVEGNFRIYTVMMLDGRVLTGMMASETRTSVEIVDAEAKRHAISREDIDRLMVSQKSLMPDGFEQQMSDDELVHLLEFLTSKGKFVPLALDRVATAISTKGMFHEGDNGADRLIFPDWTSKTFQGVPFLLIDPNGKTTPNVVLLHSPQGTLPPNMPRSVTMPVNTEAFAIHLLSGISGWGYPFHRADSVSMTVRLRYADGETEDHPLRNAVHFADYIRRVDVPESEFAFSLRGRQLRYLAIHPLRGETIAEIEFVKGNDPTAPMVVAVTIQREE